MLNREEMAIVNAIVKSYVKVMGADKWNSLTLEQQHDVIMILVKDMLKNG